MKSIKSVPYYCSFVTSQERTLATSLRAELLPKIKRRLPAHHLCGLEQGWITKFVRANKSKYPFYLRTDIRKFYPSVRHLDLIVGVQLAYRDLLGLNYVPEAFKKKYLVGLNEWTKNLPLEVRGIPLNSPLSCLTAPLMLVPMWLDMKKLWNIPFAIYMDDILILCESREQTSEIYEWLHNRIISNYDMELNVSKTESGSFGGGKVRFCGWIFAGGCARIDDIHIEAFKRRFKETVSRSSHLERSHFIKKINRKIDGFGNYYKHGNVKRQFEILDIYIRSVVRPVLIGRKRCDNGTLTALKLRSLVDIYTKYQAKLNLTKPSETKAKLKKLIPRIRVEKETSHFRDEQMLSAINSLSVKLTQIIALQRKHLRMIEKILTGGF